MASAMAGHINHSIFWTNLCPAKDYELPQGDLATAIANEFGSLEDLQDLMTTRCLGIQGSGWGWLAYNKNMDRLCLTTCANQVGHGWVDDASTVLLCSNRA